MAGISHAGVPPAPQGMKMGSGCHPEFVLNEVKDLRRICFSRRSVIEGEILHFVQNDKFWCRWFIFIPRGKKKNRIPDRVGDDGKGRETTGLENLGYQRTKRVDG